MMKKSILCLVLALCLCLCMILASCKPDEPENPDDTGKKGQIHTTPDNTAGVELEIDIPPLDGYTKPE